MTVEHMSKKNSPSGTEPPQDVPRNEMVVVSGLSGAGSTSTLKQFEDLGWEVADNIPLSLLPRLLTEFDGEGRQNVAVGVDLRTRGFSAKELIALMEEMRNNTESRISLLYLDCDEAVLMRRFTETRRRHPLANDRPLADGIRAEQQLLSGLKEYADILVDTSLLSLPELRSLLIDRFSLADHPAMTTTITSFSFKKGVPREADLVFDVRFLRNPHYDDALRPLTGQDAGVARFVKADPAYDAFVRQLEDMLLLLLPRYLAEGKSYLTVAIGCTGGRHRSVCVAENIHDQMKRTGYFTRLVHRDVDNPVPADNDKSAGTP
ncbi:RNase adapter RapZ [Sneathiella chinensis]|uniref:Nucleotide-binding protein n=2 Tax=Sneathiella chinensis TaxID=349750 RepID=A0ABQ5TYI6_9PROT|nr:RNase adapter RapZ [Sneathiella chinensis]GLQ04875.1 nucleotide-binding protein [Sneathiella chinensis]